MGRKANPDRFNQHGDILCPGCDRYLPEDMFYKRNGGRQFYCMLCERYAIARSTDEHFEPFPKNRGKNNKPTLFEQYFDRLEELGYKPVVPTFM